MTWDLWNKYENEFVDEIEKHLEQIKFAQNKIDKLTFCYPENIVGLNKIIYSLYWSQIQHFFIYCNGGLGYDVFVARRFLSYMLLYWLILTKKTNKDNDVEKCCAEIETAFYIFLNCIYNIKEKWHEFLNTTIEKNAILYSILNLDGRKIVLDNLNLLYKEIKELCNARNYLVHDVYKIRYNLKKDSILISRSKFTLSENNVASKIAEKEIYNFKVLDAISCFHGLEKQRYELLTTLSNSDYIDIEKLKSKYLNSNENGYELAIF